ncbi:MAG: periplasmic heavy metal sensor [Kiritimatiellia bacterium]|nr:periplasmic heavy metal sensor [Kiritimatiellia bacterium]
MLISSLCAGDNFNAEQQPGDNEARFEATANQLNLNEEQKEKIKALRQNQREQVQALLQQLQAKRQQMRSELNKLAATRASIAPLVAEIKDIQAKMVDLRIDNIFAIKAMLNSDQFNKLQQFQQQKMGQGRDRRQFGPGQRRKNQEQRNQE